VHGAPVLRVQDDVKRCSMLGKLRRLHGCSVSRQQSGQGSIEYVIAFAFIGVALSLLWRLISSLAGTESAFRWVVHVTYSGWADFLT
jgi:hypothetical protein